MRARPEPVRSRPEGRSYAEDEGPNVGHVDDPAFQAREARWAVERAAARARFRRAADYLGRLTAAPRAAELGRFETLHGVVARRELEGYVCWKWPVVSG